MPEKYRDLQSPKLYVLVSHPRSGSSLIASKIAQLEQFSCVMEPFHPKPEIVQQHIDMGLGITVQSWSQESWWDLRTLDGYSPKDIEIYVRDLLQACESPNIIIKLFPRHLSAEGFSALMSVTSGVVFLTRNILHSYISKEIATMTNIYGDIDTSNKHANFTITSFVRWVNRLASFMTEARQVVDQAKVPNISLQYEYFLSAKSSVDYLQAKLRYFEIPLDFDSRVRLPSRQDSRSLASEKVSNPELMTNYLNEMGLAYLDDVRAGMDVYPNLPDPQTSLD